jgi:dTDP-4-dehydrorhamnose reductase
LKILVTGSAGFIGKYLSTHLAGTITAISRQDLDLADSAAVTTLLRKQQFDVIVNCAAAGRHQLRAQDPNIVVNNLVSWSNLYSCMGDACALINIGTGAEFDLTKDILDAKEQDIWEQSPIHSYGFSKNLIARLSTQSKQCYTVRVFGCFDDSEDATRPLKRLHTKLVNDQPMIIDQDRWFDMISLVDLCSIIQHITNGNIFRTRDINAVYAEKTRLSDIFRLYCELHSLDTSMVQIKNSDGLNYTGNGTRLANLGVKLIGLEESLRRYKNE